MLACIFAFQGTIFGMGIWVCHLEGGLHTCPELGKKYENTFAVMISTTLALLTGSALRE